MALELTCATSSDASRIAEIHMTAFGSNPLLLAQFPSPTIRRQLRSCIAQKAADDIHDPYIAVLVVRDHENRIVSFAKWSLPVPAAAVAAGMGVETPWVWPDGSNLVLLERWTKLVERAERRALSGGLAYRRLSFYVGSCGSAAGSSFGCLSLFSLSLTTRRLC